MDLCLIVWSVLGFQPLPTRSQTNMSHVEKCSIRRIASLVTLPSSLADKKLAKDWISLNSQVRRWQLNAQLKWSDDDIAEAARYLNASYYHYSEPLINHRRSALSVSLGPIGLA